MSIGFKKSIFGFNRSDVVEYIEKAHNSFLEKEKKLNNKVDALSAKLEKSNEIQSKLETEKQELNKKLDEFTAKYEEIERLSENIGKLYLVAQTNAKAIIDNSEEKAIISQNEVSKNIISIEEAHKSLQELRAHITATSDNFISEVDSMMSSLAKTREQIEVNTSKIEEAKKEFAEVFESIVN